MTGSLGLVVLSLDNRGLFFDLVFFDLILLVVLAFNLLHLWLDLGLNLHIIVETSFREDATEDLFLLLFEVLQGYCDVSEFFLCLGICWIVLQQFFEIGLCKRKCTCARSKSWLFPYATPRL